MDRWIREPRAIAARYRTIHEEIAWRFHGRRFPNPRSDEECKRIAKGMAAALNAVVAQVPR